MLVDHIVLADDEARCRRPTVEVVLGLPNNLIGIIPFHPVTEAALLTIPA